VREFEEENDVKMTVQERRLSWQFWHSLRRGLAFPTNARGFDMYGFQVPVVPLGFHSFHLIPFDLISFSSHTVVVVKQNDEGLFGEAPVHAYKALARLIALSTKFVSEGTADPLVNLAP
jgi:hypothetical protein